MFLERETKFGGGGVIEPKWRGELRRHHNPKPPKPHPHQDTITRAESWLILLQDWWTRPHLARDERKAMFELRPRLMTAVGQLARLVALSEIEIADLSADLADHVQRATKSIKEREENDHEP